MKITYKKHGVVLIFFPTKSGNRVSYFFAVMEHRFPTETSAVGIFFSQVKVDIILFHKQSAKNSYREWYVKQEMEFLRFKFSN